MNNPFDYPVERIIKTIDSQGVLIPVSVRRRPDARIPTLGGYGILPGRLYYTIPNGMTLETTEDELVFTSNETDEVLRKFPLVDRRAAVSAKSVDEEGDHKPFPLGAEDSPLLGRQKDAALNRRVEDITMPDQ